jgi:hypothetical protein
MMPEQIYVQFTEGIRKNVIFGEVRRSLITLFGAGKGSGDTQKSGVN